jgi:hypothetical protein
MRILAKENHSRTHDNGVYASKNRPDAWTTPSRRNNGIREIGRRRLGEDMKSEMSPDMRREKVLANASIETCRLASREGESSPRCRIVCNIVPNYSQLNKEIVIRN